MTAIVPTGTTLGATVEGLDLSEPLTPEDTDAVRRALGEHGVLRFPKQVLDAALLTRFGSQFGELVETVLGSGGFTEPGVPEVDVLSNIIEDGKPVGLADAGQDWHTDLSYNNRVALANILYAVEVPVRDGEPLGRTEFQNMHAAYEDLPAEIKEEFGDATVTFDFNKFWDMMRSERGSSRPPLTPEQRARTPQVSHPMFIRHPITGRYVLYANPGYAVRVDGLREEESKELLDYLFAHQLQEKYRYRFHWTVGDVLMWDDIGTLHRAIGDYLPTERRLMKRCRVLTDGTVG